jgi:hypothetical protein
VKSAVLIDTTSSHIFTDKRWSGAVTIRPECPQFGPQATSSDVLFGRYREKSGTDADISEDHP